MISLDNLISLLNTNTDTSTSTSKVSPTGNDKNNFESLLGNFISDKKNVSNSGTDFSDIKVEEIGVSDVTIKKDPNTKNLILKIDSIITPDTSKEDIKKLLFKLGSIIASLNSADISSSQNNIDNKSNTATPVDVQSGPTNSLDNSISNNSPVSNLESTPISGANPILNVDNASKINELSNSENIPTDTTVIDNTKNIDNKNVIKDTDSSSDVSNKSATDNNISNKLDTSKDIEKEMDALLAFLNYLQNINSVPNVQSQNTPQSSPINSIDTENMSNNVTNTVSPNLVGPLNSVRTNNNDLDNNGIPDDVNIISDSMVGNHRIIISNKPFDVSALSKNGVNSDIDAKLDSITEKLDKIFNGDKKIVSDFLNKLTKVLNKDILTNKTEDSITNTSTYNKKEDIQNLDNKLELSSIVNTSMNSSPIEDVKKSSDIHPVASQIFNILQTHILKNNGEDKLTNIRLKLFPAKLGNVNIELETVGKSVNVKMYADNEYARDVLQSSIKDLITSFNSKDVNVSNINVFVGSEQQNQQQQQNNNYKNNNYTNTAYSNEGTEDFFDFGRFQARKNISERLLDIKI